MTDLVGKWASIGLDRDYTTLKLDDLKIDLQGWGSEHPVFQFVIETYKPQLIIEVGTWKGASLLHMAKLAERAGLDTQFICIDTWLGSNDVLWLSDEYRQSLLLEGGYPTMYRQFIRNILDNGISDRVFPLPMTSSAAYHLLKRLGVQPDMVYIDAGHKEEEVAIDLDNYFDILRPSGVMFGDDYMLEWPGVIAAVNKFVAKHSLPLLASPGKFVIRKP